MVVRNLLTTLLSVVLLLSSYPKLASAGEWAKIYGDTGTSESIQQTSDGGYVAAGGTCYDELPTPYSEFKVIKLNEQRDILWQKVYDAGFTSAKTIQEDSDGGYIVLGQSCGANTDNWILKLDNN
jgi:hypothetical protein